MFRDGNDLVLVGNFNSRPTQVRFSYDENTPGLNVRMQAPVSFTFSVVPASCLGNVTATKSAAFMRPSTALYLSTAAVDATVQSVPC